MTDMNKGRRRKLRRAVGAICLLLSAAALTGAAALFLSNLREERAAEEHVEAVLPLLHDYLEENPGRADEDGTSGELSVELDGDAYIGILYFPTLDLELPVMAEWNYDNLKKSPCRYQGTAEEDNLIIAGHNYRRHFTRLKTMHVGERLSYTDMRGVTVEYEVCALETIHGEDTASMSAGDWDLTLFTCTTGGEYRFAVRCVRVE